MVKVINDVKMLIRMADLTVPQVIPPPNLIISYEDGWWFDDDNDD